jgi:hypothetical protein
VSVVTFDFDNTLTVTGFDPEDGVFSRDCGPNLEALQAIKDHVEEGHSVHIVTSRGISTSHEVENFLRENGIESFISGVHFTLGDFKAIKLSELKSIKHFDDDPEELAQLSDDITGVLWTTGHLDENDDVCDPEDPRFHFDNWD